MNLKELINIFNEIKNTSSRTEKEKILKQNQNNKEFRELLTFLYNPFVLTGIKEKKLNKFRDFKSNDVQQFDNVFDVINYIKVNNSGRDEDIKTISNFINQYDGEVKEFLISLLTKDLKCGITSKTINKVYGKNAIPEFNVMLAKSYNDEESKVTGEFFVTEKLDGIRCVVLKQNNNVKFFTRQGQEIEGLVQIEEELKNEFPNNYMFDGELLLDNPNNLPSDQLFRETQKVIRKDGNKKNVIYHVFDSMPIEEFIAGKSKLVYSERRKILNNMFGNLPQKYVKLLPVLYSGTDKNKIFDLLTEIDKQGKEGLIINIARGYYVTKRTDVLLKVKTMHTIDLMVIGYEEGTGKNKETLGALIVDYKGYPVKVGSGYTDEERNEIWNMRAKIIGKIVEIQYFEESSNQNGGISLRFPVFKRIRDDKGEPSLH